MAFTKNDNVNEKSKYECFNSINRCLSSWTYDNYHCNGCHWKGLGTQDIATDDSGKLEQEAKSVEMRLQGLEA